MKIGLLIWALMAFLMYIDIVTPGDQLVGVILVLFASGIFIGCSEVVKGMRGLTGK